MMSWRVRSSAVAVSAMRGTFGKPLCQNLELTIFGPEVVTPLRDAVRLVDCEKGDVAAFE